jgi:hypothetical protein
MEHTVLLKSFVVSRISSTCILSTKDTDWRCFLACSVLDNSFSGHACRDLLGMYELYT